MEVEPEVHETGGELQRVELAAAAAAVMALLVAKVIDGLDSDFHSGSAVDVAGYLHQQGIAEEEAEIVGGGIMLLHSSSDCSAERPEYPVDKRKVELGVAVEAVLEEVADKDVGYIGESGGHSSVDKMTTATLLLLDDDPTDFSDEGP